MLSFLGYHMLMALDIKEHIPLAPYTIYKIGGSARFFVEVTTADDVAEALGFAAERGLPFVIIGAGSNMLVSDHGFDGVAIRMIGGSVRAEGERLACDAGVMMARAVLAAGKAGLSGFEWGIGVPGTIGGSVRGNAGCFGSEMKDVVENIEVFDASHNSKYIIQNSECHFAYRDSIFKKHPEWIILSAVLKLKKGDAVAIQQEVQRFSMERLAKQDIGTSSAGCIFKNIPWTRDDINREEVLGRFPDIGRSGTVSGISAGLLIDRAGLKGIRIGGAVISPKHANFFINEGTASAEDIRGLIKRAKDEVQKKFGILIEEEIQYVG